MTRNVCRNLRCASTLFAAATILTLSARAQLTNPSQEELKMSAPPSAPGAPAVYLDRDVIIDNGIQTYSAHVRIKVLTDAGKKYAEVELPTVAGGKSFAINELQARTIHSDGTVVPFSGAPADKSTPGGTVKAFTLPDVQVGSILEYQYKLTMPVQTPVPSWILQSELYTRKMHYIWRLSGDDFYKLNRAPAAADAAVVPDAGSGGGRGGRGGGGGGGGGAGRPAEGEIEALSWASFLPKDAEVTQSILPGGLGMVAHAGMRTVELSAKDVPPAPAENNGPPAESTLYRVLFYYSGYPDAATFWKMKGADWSKNKDAFMTVDPALSGATQALAPSADAADAKLKKIYAAIMNIQNSDYAPAGLAAAPVATSVSQVWTNKSGTSNQLAELFVSMARATGLKAYIMAVPNREKAVFLADFLNVAQMTDEIAIVEVAGKEQFFDPGARYCTYGHLAWQHAAMRGMRQLDGGATNIIQVTPGEPYIASITQRVSDLTMAADGSLSGPVTLYFTGSPALEWRQRALREGEPAIREAFSSLLQHMLPAGVETDLAAINDLNNGEAKLTVRYIIKGGLGTKAGGRITVPSDLFEASATPIFTSDKRELPIDFHYPFQIQDISRIKFPAGFSVESAPQADKDAYAKSAAYSFTTETNATSVTVRRTATVADSIIPAAEYSGLKAYTAKLQQKSQQSVVLKAGGSAAGN